MNKFFKEETQNAALSGIKIADFSRVLAGPYATMMLADLGAEVIKVERPGLGDETRGWGPPFDSQGRSSYFQSVNRNKQSIALDLNNPEESLRAQELILESDVVVENFGFDGMKKFNLDYETVSKKHPKLVYCSITGFGSSIRARELAGYDLLVQAMSGLMSITGSPSSEPNKVGVALIDVLAGLHAVSGILGALRARDKFGSGQQVEINLFSSALSGMVNQSGAYVAAGVVPGRLGNSHPSIVPYGVFQSSDRSFIVAVGNDQQFARLANILGISINERNSTNSARVKNRSEVEQTLNASFSSKSAETWIELLNRERIPSGPINDISEAFKLAEGFDLDPIIEIGDSRTVANPIKFSKSKIIYRKPPPSLDN
jgi:crotonobetainyl-CoA:carnitine CoA-transferase CaiB-like acyl-CoA transferase